jgi:hypothetical protein
MADYYTHFSVGVQLIGKAAEEWITEALRSRRQKRDELSDAGDDDAADEVPIDFEYTVEDAKLYLSDNGMSGNVEHVAHFLQELVTLGYVQEPVAVQWADTCSRSRVDAFTGGGVVVTKRKLYSFPT